jgi:lambda family phage portal protein
MRLKTRLSNAYRALFATRSYEAGGAGARWPLTASMASPVQQGLASRAVIARRASWLVANAPLGESAVLCFQTSLVGDGPSVRSRHPNEAIRAALEGAWNDGFYTRADIEGGDLCAFLGRCVRCLVTHGESFTRLLTTSRGELRLQLLNPEQIDPALNRELEGGARIVAGVELGSNGERLAYHVRPESPDQWITTIAPAVRVSADDVLHVYEPRNPGQTRGMSWFAPVATRLLELDSVEDAAIMKAKTTALLAGFIRDLEGGSAADDLASGELSLEPGTLRRLPPGQDITFSPTSDMSGLNDFLKHMARTIGSGVGVPYELLTGDLSGVNYSSAKLGLEAFKRRCLAIRASLLGTRLLDPIWRRFATLEVLSGRLSVPDFARDPESYFAATWMFPGWPALDPYREAAADVVLMRAGVRSRDEVVSSRGRDVAEVTAEIEADPLREMVATASPRLGASGGVGGRRRTAT